MLWVRSFGMMRIGISDTRNPDHSTLKPGFHMIATIAAIAEKKKFSDRSDHSDHENENDFHTIAELFFSQRS